MQHSEKHTAQTFASINISELNARSFSSLREIHSRRQFISRGPPLILRENSRTHNFIEISRVFHGSVLRLTRTFFYSAARKMAMARDAWSAGVTMKNPPRFIPFFRYFFFSFFLSLFLQQSYNFGPRVHVILF